MEYIRDVVNWSRPAKCALLVIFDFFFVVVSAFLALALEELSQSPIERITDHLAFVGMAAVISLSAFAVFRLYSQMVRYAGPRIIMEAFRAMFVAGLVLLAIDKLTALTNVGAGVIIVFSAFSLLCVICSRMSARWLISTSRRAHGGMSERTAIYGAGDGGLALFEALAHNPLIEVVAFLDDDKKLAGRRINRCEVFSSTRTDEVVKQLGIKRIILAIPSASRRRRSRILRRLETAGVKVQMLPSVNEIMGGQISVSDIRDVRASDLLWRKRHDANTTLLQSDVKDRSVMVTGGGGSIGSELCRQIVAANTARLVIIEQSEYALYLIDRELNGVIRKRGLSTTIVPILCDVCDQASIERHMQRHGVQTVYHAAAYKHVPMVESNACEGIHNNVVGTLAAARAAMATNVDKFVLVSTDKAVRPTNVMGASKRLSEMILQALQSKEEEDSPVGKPRLRFTMVRFGNVLDSAGSVVPLFKKQIREGGPITLTHREVTRYFMTIPEAAQLVLQAGAMALGGEVFLLEMGEPVRIYDLARRMVHLSGLSVADEDNPEGDIEIRVTGMRPGEKLHEELFIGTNIAGTNHPAILRAEENHASWSDLVDFLEHLKTALEEADEDTLRSLLAEMVEGYKARRRVFVERRQEPRLTVVPNN